MSKIKSAMSSIWLLSLLAIGVGAIAASPASAVPIFSFCHKAPVGITGTYREVHCENEETGGPYLVANADTAASLLLCYFKEGGKFQNKHCTVAGIGNWERELVAVATPELLATPIGAQVFKGKFAGNNFKIECTEGMLTTQPESAGKSSAGKIEYTKCKVVEPAGCTVTEPLTGEFTDQLGEAGGKPVDQFKGAKGAEKAFVEVKFGGEKCILKGQSLLIKGSQTCESDAAIETFKLLHELICTEAGSNLEVGKIAVTYAGKLSVVAANGEAWAVLLEP